MTQEVIPAHRPAAWIPVARSGQHAPMATPEHHAAVDALADRFFAAVERGDIDAVDGIYTADARVWHNYDDVAQDRDANMRVLRWFTGRLAGMRYEDVRRVVLDDGFVQQHVLRGTAPDGTRLEVHAMMRVWCDGSQISRIDEYLDPAQAAALSR